MLRLISAFILLWPFVSVACPHMFDTIPKKPLAKDERKQIAKEMYERLVEIDNAIPRLSPKEERWARGEIDSGDSSRSACGLGSTEGPIYIWQRKIGPLKDAVRILRDGNYTSKQQEIAVWAAVIVQLIETLFWEIVPVLNDDRQISIPKVMGSDYELYTSSCVFKGRIILEYIVFPYLANQLPE